MHLLNDAALYLSKPEREKSNNFINSVDQQRYIIQRILIRKELSVKLQMEPHKIEFEYSQYGKPFISNTSWKFNVSHSKQMLMIGFIKDSEIGVDIEYIDYQNDIHTIIDSVLTEQELAIYKQKNQQDKITYFYRLWTRKEAYTKAIGKGLNINFNTLNSVNTKNAHFNSGIKNSFSWTYTILP